MLFSIWSGDDAIADDEDQEDDEDRNDDDDDWMTTERVVEIVGRISSSSRCNPFRLDHLSTKTGDGCIFHDKRWVDDAILIWKVVCIDCLSTN